MGNILTNSLKRINFRLFGVLVLMSLLPTLYVTVRIHFIGALPGDWGYNIASQISWLNVTYEVIHEALMLPMFFLLGRFLKNKRNFENAVSNGLILVVILYAVLSTVTAVFARQMIVLMAQRTDLVDATVDYIRLEAASLVLSAVMRYFTLVLITIKRDAYLLAVLCIQLVLSVILDSVFLSSLSFSLQLGVNGIAYTNIIVNTVLIVLLVWFLRRENVNLFSKQFIVDWRWLKDWLRIGGISGLESFVRNAAFILMVIRLVNVVQEQGTFWVTNNFIWGWLLIPVLALGELIKRDAAEDPQSVIKNEPAYIFLTSLFIGLWFITIPFWKGFIINVMGVSNFEVIFKLSLVSLGFYIVFAFNNIADSVFYGRGRTDLMLYQSLIVNTLFYGCLFIFYRFGIYKPTLIGITIMFGTGIAIDSFITFIMYKQFRRRLARELSNR